MLDCRVPVSIDDPKKAFIWDLDVFLIFMSGIGIGIISRHFILSIALFSFLAWRWGKLKSGKHQWYFLHILYWYLPIQEKNKRIPDTHQREFLK
ncbi:type IV conjugative transfer system protein TraL [Neisseria weixii]|uniref:Type IV conjugative transfer system protein TraL n=1 Tax=Neisseria weixii TaxID=1853276 RepID=A0A3N4N471_9NEIS|nr:type IV conjugative transfer system protein TraL [Neisseria weixii]RPD86119.1 type IV conjugative transfer system protein TraL [Neisseria weixii]RPD86852.1 type IV conjugative transfer system protein TraL [Neisseria weixii]